MYVCVIWSTVVITPCIGLRTQGLYTVHLHYIWQSNLDAGNCKEYNPHRLVVLLQCQHVAHDSLHQGWNRTYHVLCTVDLNTVAPFLDPCHK